VAASASLGTKSLKAVPRAGNSSELHFHGLLPNGRIQSIDHLLASCSISYAVKSVPNFDTRFGSLEQTSMVGTPTEAAHQVPSIKTHFLTPEYESYQNYG
jgi:hypothetical protein